MTTNTKLTIDQLRDALSDAKVPFESVSNIFIYFYCIYIY